MSEYIVILAIGFVMVAIALKVSRKQTKIKKNGLNTEGIVYELLNDQSSSSFNIRYPVIRFLTRNQEWITEASNISMFPGFYKTGQKVTVIYNQEDPKQFIIDSKINNLMVHAILIAGAIFILYGAYELV